MSDPVFIVGMPRSGTTLVASVLSRHPKIHICGETHFLSHFWRTRKSLDLSIDGPRSDFLDYLSKSKWFVRLGISTESLLSEFQANKETSFKGIFKWIISRTSKEIFGEKTPGHYEHIEDLRDWFASAKIVFCVRDPRDVVRSNLEAPFGAKHTTFHSHRWRRAGESLMRFRDFDWCFVLRYEDLVYYQESEIRKLCRFIGVAYDPLMLSENRGDKEINGTWRDSHLAKASGSIYGGSIGAWREYLSNRDIINIEIACRDIMLDLNYAPHMDGNNLRDVIEERLRYASMRFVMGFRRRFLPKKKPSDEY